MKKLFGENGPFDLDGNEIERGDIVRLIGQDEEWVVAGWGFCSRKSDDPGDMVELVATTHDFRPDTAARANTLRIVRRSKFFELRKNNNENLAAHARLSLESFNMYLRVLEERGYTWSLDPKTLILNIEKTTIARL